MQLTTTDTSAEQLPEKPKQINGNKHQMRCPKCKSFKGITGCKKCNEKEAKDENH